MRAFSYASLLDGGHTIRSAVSENSLITTRKRLCFIELLLIEVLFL